MNLIFRPHLKQIGTIMETVNWAEPKIYAAYLAQLYYYVLHSTRLLALGASRMPFEDEAAHQRFLQHVGEENNHEKLALRDCKAMGYGVLDFPELPATRAFYQTQYYLIEHVSPWAFMGYVLALEMMAQERANWLHEQVTKFHGPGRSTFLTVHGEEDEDHVEKAIQLLESRSEKDQKVIQESFETSIFLYATIFQNLETAASLCKQHKNQAA